MAANWVKDVFVPTYSFEDIFRLPESSNDEDISKKYWWNEELPKNDPVLLERRDPANCPCKQCYCGNVAKSIESLQSMSSEILQLRSQNHLIKREHSKERIHISQLERRCGELRHECDTLSSELILLKSEFEKLQGKYAEAIYETVQWRERHKRSKTKYKAQLLEQAEAANSTLAKFALELQKARAAQRTAEENYLRSSARLSEAVERVECHLANTQLNGR